MYVLFALLAFLAWVVPLVCSSFYLFLFFWGGGDRNEGAVSVEAEVELALYLSGGISKDNFGNLRKVSWSRAGRTDKGVHAAAQVMM